MSVGFSLEKEGLTYRVLVPRWCYVHEKRASSTERRPRGEARADLYVVCPNGVPKEVEESVVPIHPDGTPYNWRPNNDPVLVDFLGKKVYGF